MAKVITIFSVFSSIASILSFVYIYFSKNDPKKMKKFNKVTGIAFGIALLISIYVLFGPTTILEKNVESKITYYSEDKNEDNIIVEEGEFIYTGLGEQSIEYYIPYKDIPNVEIVNINGYNNIPKISKVTENQFIVSRNTTIGESNEKYRWIARGKPLKQIQGN